MLQLEQLVLLALQLLEGTLHPLALRHHDQLVRIGRRTAGGALAPGSAA